MSFDAIFWALCAVAAAAALVHGLFFLNAKPSPLRAAVKTVMMAALALALIHAQAPPLLIVAAVASGIGDAFLAFEQKWVLPLGIGAFLVAQLCYLFLFHASVDGSAPLWLRYGLTIAVSLTALVFLIWLAPKLGVLAAGVVPYSLAIAAMAMQAMWLPWAGWPAMLGVASFLVSDGVLSAELFQLPPDAPARRVTGPVVWWTYAAAQGLIVWGMLRVLA